MRLKLILVVQTQHPVPPVEMELAIDHARRMAHVLLEQGSVSVSRPSVIQPGRDQFAIEFIAPDRRPQVDH